MTRRRSVRFTMALTDHSRHYPEKIHIDRPNLARIYRALVNGAANVQLSTSGTFEQTQSAADRNRRFRECEQLRVVLWRPRLSVRV